MGRRAEAEVGIRTCSAPATHQPAEPPLPLTIDDLAQLGAALREAGSEPQEIRMKKFVVVPITAAQRMIGDFPKWITGG